MRDLRSRRSLFGAALVAVLTALVLAGLAFAGGVGHAVSEAADAVRLVKHTDARPAHPRIVVNSPARDQYRPGCGLGDKNHVHTGPPGRGGICPATASKPASGH